MFAMLQGRWPRVLADGTRLGSDGTIDGRSLERAVDEAVAAQVESGMGLIHDGWVRWADPEAAVLDALRDRDTGDNGRLVRAWRSVASRAGASAACAVVPGPWTLATREGGAPGGTVGDVAQRALAHAHGLAGELAALGGAGCAIVVVHEPGAAGLEPGAGAADGYRAAHAALLAQVAGLHAMLAVTGGAASGAGEGTVLAAPYASFLFDLVAGPDDWRLVRAVPGDRGIVVAALEAGEGRERRDQAPELVWAAQYAASANARGLDRVGLANASPLHSLTAAEARAALDALARAASLAALPVRAAVEAGLDPRVLPHGAVPGLSVTRDPTSRHGE